jgi:hypothetical protein
VIITVTGRPSVRAWGLDGPSGAKIDPVIEKLKAENTDTRRDAANKIRLAAKSVQKQAVPVLIDRLANDRTGRSDWRFSILLSHWGLMRNRPSRRF